MNRLDALNRIRLDKMLDSAALEPGDRSDCRYDKRQAKQWLGGRANVLVAAL